MKKIGCCPVLPFLSVLLNTVGIFVEKRQQQTTIASTKDNDGTHSLSALAAQNVTGIKIQKKGSPDVFEPPVKPLPPGAPNWSLRLRGCKSNFLQCGYCNTEAELEAVLLLHKQQTHAVFGTRQSSSPAKPATRLMWKSQYVPYDGIPFVNAGNMALFACGICGVTLCEIPLFKS
ncbi:hypothetical protein PO909_033587 [Leuciscus waleckii]